jgi:hypothetical protein
MFTVILTGVRRSRTEWKDPTTIPLGKMSRNFSSGTAGTRPVFGYNCGLHFPSRHNQCFPEETS